MFQIVLAVVGLVGAADPASELTAEIDRRVAARWQAAGVTPADTADDAEFARRAWLDLTGNIPLPGDLRSFLADPAPDKRRRLVDRLLVSPAFARHRAATWRGDWVPQASEAATEGFAQWLEEQLLTGTPYDCLVREMLTASLRPADNASQPSAARGFFVANDFKPENLAANSARLFLGLNLECAQCHDHPFARWSHEQFWQYAAFFSDRHAAGPDQPIEIQIPMLEKVALARFPDGGQPAWQGNDDPRRRLVDWMTGEQNRYFARNAVNRLWADLLGHALVEPLDDLSGAVAPSHPELFDALADSLVESGYDVRHVIRAIMASRAYQLTSAISPSAAASAATDDPQLFARAALRPLSAEQLLDAYLRAAGVDPPNENDRHEFLEQFRLTDRRPDPETSILQSLLRMNGSLVSAATEPASGRTLAALEAPFLDPASRIEALYVAVLSRPPAADEARRMGEHVAGGGSQGLADVLWVLLNSPEFTVNH